MKIINRLLSFGSDPNVIDAQGRDSLLHAASKGAIETVKWLLKEGFDPNYADRDGWTALHWAAKNGSADTIEVLKAAGAISRIETIKGWTPDSVAIFHHNNPPSKPIAIAAYENELSELAIEKITRLLASTIQSEEDERMIVPGLLWKRCTCDGCLLVSFDLIPWYTSSSNRNRKSMVYVTSVWTAQILTTVSSAKTHQIRVMLVIDLMH